MITKGELKARYNISEEELAELEASAKAFESGNWPSGKITRVGRPSIAAEEVKPITVRLPVSQINALDGKARNTGGTRSSAVREAVSDWLMQA